MGYRITGTIDRKAEKRDLSEVFSSMETKTDSGLSWHLAAESI